MSQAVLVTGVSSGIGKATAIALVEEGYYVYGSVRDPIDGEKLKHEVTIPDNLEIIVFDVTDFQSVKSELDTIKTNDRGLFGIVNNAGVAIAGPMKDISMKLLRYQMEVNFFGMVNITQQLIPLLKNSDGRLVQMSSISGQEPFAFFGPYAASKHAMEAVTDSMRREMSGSGIKFSIIEPGVIDTPIWDKGQEKIDTSRYDGEEEKMMENLKNNTLSKAKKIALPVDKVVEAVLDALQSNNPKQRYIVMPTFYKLGFRIRHIFPKGFRDGFFTSL